MRWRQAERIEVSRKGHKGDEEQMGSVHVRTRTEIRGSKSSFRVYGGAVGHMLESIDVMLSSLPYRPLSSYRRGKSVRVVMYDRARRAIKE